MNEPRTYVSDFLPGDRIAWDQDGAGEFVREIDDGHFSLIIDNLGQTRPILTRILREGA